VNAYVNIFMNAYVIYIMYGFNIYIEGFHMKTNKTVDEVMPRDGKGIFTVIEIICGNKDSIFETKQWKFWLPESTYKAAALLREHLAYNRLVGISDEDCEKRIAFHIKNVELRPGYYFLKNQLTKLGIKVDEVYESDSKSADKH